MWDNVFKHFPIEVCLDCVQFSLFVSISNNASRNAFVPVSQCTYAEVPYVLVVSLVKSIELHFISMKSDNMSCFWWNWSIYMYYVIYFDSSLSCYSMLPVCPALSMLLFFSSLTLIFISIFLYWFNLILYYFTLGIVAYLPVKVEG